MISSDSLRALINYQRMVPFHRRGEVLSTRVRRWLGDRPKLEIPRRDNETDLVEYLKALDEAIKDYDVTMRDWITTAPADPIEEARELLECR